MDRPLTPVAQERIMNPDPWRAVPAADRREADEDASKQIVVLYMAGSFQVCFILILGEASVIAILSSSVEIATAWVSSTTKRADSRLR